MWKMFDSVECDATILLDYFQSPQGKIVDSLPLIENTLEWYDHISCAFLLYDDPREALEKISMLRESYNNKTGWRQIVLTPLFQPNRLNSSNVSEKLSEAIFLVKHYGLLNMLEIAANSTANIDPLRLELFQMIDKMSEEQATLWVDEMTSVGFPKNESSWCLEMHCLRWIEVGKISKEHDLSTILIQPPAENVAVSETPEAVIPRAPKVITSTEPDKFQILRGLCVIFNQMRFYVDQDLGSMGARENLAYRYGSDADRDQLSETFRMLGHDVEVYENLSKRNLLRTIQRISSYDFKIYDSLVMCFLTHGERGILFSADSLPIELDQIKSFFNGVNCKDLLEKPKLFFLQACQGQENQRRICYDEIEADSIVRPSISNFFEAWATVPGFLSYRSTYKGAVFVRELCHVLQNYAHLPNYGLLDLTTKVNDRVSRWETPGFKVQMPCLVSSLTRKVHFKRNEDKLVEAVVDQLERELMDLAIMSATRYMWTNDKASLQITLNTWRS